ncbi:MAG: hypothetical protein WCI73_21175, partial [Phycisphaerae bacterium]
QRRDKNDRCESAQPACRRVAAGSRVWGMCRSSWKRCKRLFEKVLVLNRNREGATTVREYTVAS